MCWCFKSLLGYNTAFIAHLFILCSYKYTKEYQLTKLWYLRGRGFNERRFRCSSIQSLITAKIIISTAYYLVGCHFLPLGYFFNKSKDPYKLFSHKDSSRLTNKWAYFIFAGLFTSRAQSNNQRTLLAWLHALGLRGWIFHCWICFNLWLPHYKRLYLIDDTRRQRWLVRWNRMVYVLSLWL